MDKVECRIKRHIKKHKVAYGLLAGTVVGSTITYLIVKQTGGTIDVVNKQGIAVNSPITNNISQVTQIVRRGHAGDIIQCVETGEQWSSQRQLCNSLGIDRRDLYRHLNGQIDSLDGRSYAKIGSFNND